MLKQDVKRVSSDTHASKSFSDLYPGLVSIPNKPYPLYRSASMMPVLRTAFGVSCITLTSFLISKTYFPNLKMQPNMRGGMFLLSYWAAAFALRLREQKSTSVLFEAMWGCNSSLFMTAIGCLLGRPLMISSSAALVGLDQFAFVLDLLLYGLTGSFPLGAAGYLTAADQTLWKNLTSMHHAWFVPYAMLMLKIGKSKFDEKSWLVGTALASGLVVLGRFLTPEYIWYPISEVNRDDTGNTLQAIDTKMKSQSKLSWSESYFKINKESTHYLTYCNINCGHRFDPNVNIPFFHMFNDKPWPLYWMYITLVAGGLNYFPSLVLLKISKKYLES